MRTSDLHVTMDDNTRRTVLAMCVASVLITLIDAYRRLRERPR